MKTRQWMVAIAAAGTLLAACNNALEPEEEITTGSISGLVYEATSGSAVPMASITTVPPSSSVTTDDGGGYAIPDIPAGVYRVIVRKVGFDSASVSISVVAGGTATGDIPVRQDTTLTN